MFVALWIQTLLLIPCFPKAYIRTYVLETSRQLLKTHLLRQILCLYQQGSATTHTASIFVLGLVHASCDNNKQGTAVSFSTSGALRSILLGSNVKGQKYYLLIILTLKTFERQHWGCREQHVFRCDFYLWGQKRFYEPFLNIATKNLVKYTKQKCMNRDRRRIRIAASYPKPTVGRNCLSEEWCKAIEIILFLYHVVKSNLRNLQLT
jgi:hypothetical protein